jgi:hypothetical protein
MDDSLLETLLNEEESSTLDFKREQYPFIGASDEEKSELLKDVLAFANAWRRTPAYILIGVEEVRGGRSRVIGVTTHLSDNDLQQFVNSKTQRPITFRYIAFPFEGAQIGVIEIPVQDRPFYLTRSFRRLTPNTVYVRRSSSTDIADPDEIARMGASLSRDEAAVPSFSLQWGDRVARAAVGTSIEIAVDVLDPRPDPRDLVPRQSSSSAIYGVMGYGTPGVEDIAAAIDYAYNAHLIRPLSIVLESTTGTAGVGVTVVGRVPKINTVRLLDYGQRPIRPGRSMWDLISPTRPQLMPTPEPDIKEYAGHWELQIPFGTVVPRAMVWATLPIFVGAEQPSTLELPLQIFAENLPTPIEAPLKVDIRTNRRPMAPKDLTNDPFG